MLLHISAWCCEFSRVRMVMSTCTKSTSSSGEDYTELRRGPWTLEEDTLLSQYISSHGEGSWNLLAKRSGLRRTGKSCRLRWLNYLKPDVKRGNLTPQEQFLILELHSKLGNRWSKIAQHLPGRTDNEIKNYWRTRVQKQARHLKIDTDSTEFREFIRRFWMPRLLQKAKLSSSSPMLPKHQAFPLPFDTVHSHDSSTEATPTPTPIVWHETCMNWYQKEHNSDSEHYNSSHWSSSESANMYLPMGYNNNSSTSSQFHALDHNSKLSGTFAYDDDYFVNNNCYDIDTFNLQTARAAEDVAESNSIYNNFACNMCSMDELLQFTNFQK